MDQPRGRRAKAARVEVERCQLGLEVDVEPLASCGLGVLSCEVDDPCSDALALVSPVRLRVDEKGVVCTVRYDVDEANEAPAAVAGRYPPQTVWTDSIPQPASAFPPWASTSSTISASVNGPRQRYVTPSETNSGRTAGEAKNDQITQLRPRRSGHIPELSPTLLAYVAGGDVARAA